MKQGRILACTQAGATMHEVTESQQQGIIRTQQLLKYMFKLLIHLCMHQEHLELKP
jgi:hypothetical protein